MKLGETLRTVRNISLAALLTSAASCDRPEVLKPQEGAQQGVELSADPITAAVIEGVQSAWITTLGHPGELYTVNGRAYLKEFERIGDYDKVKGIRAVWEVLTPSHEYLKSVEIKDLKVVIDENLNLTDADKANKIVARARAHIAYLWNHSSVLEYNPNTHAVRTAQPSEWKDGSDSYICEVEEDPYAKYPPTLCKEVAAPNPQSNYNFPVGGGMNRVVFLTPQER